MEKSELQKLSPGELINLSETNTSDFRWNRSDIYKIAFEKCEKNGEKEKLGDIKKEILIFDLSTHNSPKKRFDSMMSGTTDKGEEWKYPDLEKHFSKGSIEYYKKRANVTNNPVLKARYSDIVWELDKDVNYARLAIRAYLDCCPIYFTNEWDYELADSLVRALEISSMISDSNLLEECLKNFYKFIKKLCENNIFKYLKDIIDKFLERRDNFNSDLKYDYLISIAEMAIDFYSETPEDNFDIQREYIKLIAKILRIRNDMEGWEKAKVKIAESFEEEAEWKGGNYPHSNMVAADLYSKAMQLYMELGNYPPKVEELKVKIQKVNKIAREKEYSRISTEVTIPKREIDRYLDNYKGRDIIDIFYLISGDKNLIPSYKESKKQALEDTRKFVFQHLVPVSLMRGNIRLMTISGEEEKVEYNTIRNFQLEYLFNSHILLKGIFELIDKDYDNFIEEMIKYLANSELFDRERIEIIKEGLICFEEEKYLASMHILVFQIEGILRDLLGKLRLPTFVYRKEEMRERMLPDILNTLAKVKGVEEDFIKFINIFLCDIRGDNLRNNIAHGLLRKGDFTKEKALLLLLIIIKLASYQIGNNRVKITAK